MKLFCTILGGLLIAGGLLAQETTFSKDFKDAKFADALSEISKTTGTKVFVEESVKGNPLTTSFADSTAENAMSVICTLNKLAWKRLTLPKDAKDVSLESVRTLVNLLGGAQGTVGLYDPETKKTAILVKDAKESLGSVPAPAAQQVVFYIFDPAAPKESAKPKDKVDEMVKGYQDFLKSYLKMSADEQKRWDLGWAGTMQNLDPDTMANFMMSGFRLFINMDPNKRNALFMKMYQNLSPEERKRMEGMGPPGRGGGGGSPPPQ